MMPLVPAAVAKTFTFKDIDMSKMADLQIEILELLEQGKFPYEVAQELGIPEDWVDEVVFDMYRAQPDNV